MLIFVCDTSTDYAVFAVGTDSGELLASYTFKHQRDLSQRFYGSLDRVFGEARVSLRDIDILAVGIGPGSFTGVRVAVTTLKTLAQASSKLLVSVGTLAAYAKGAGISTTAVAVLPSRRGELYFQVFDQQEEQGPPIAASYDRFSQVLDSLQDQVTLCGQVQALPDQYMRYMKAEQTSPPVQALLDIAAVKIGVKDFADPITLTPMYAAPPAISQHKNRQ